MDGGCVAHGTVARSIQGAIKTSRKSRRLAFRLTCVSVSVSPQSPAESWPKSSSAIYMYPSENNQHDPFHHNPATATAT